MNFSYIQILLTSVMNKWNWLKNVSFIPGSPWRIYFLRSDTVRPCCPCMCCSPFRLPTPINLPSLVQPLGLPHQKWMKSTLVYSAIQIYTYHSFFTFANQRIFHFIKYSLFFLTFKSIGIFLLFF